MLVLISVGVVTVASIGFLAASSSAPEIGTNAVLGARARVAADTGIDLAEAIMQCSNIDWRASATDGVLVENFDYGGETITIRVTDPDGNLPAADCEYVTVTANGKSNLMTQAVVADIYTPQEEASVDVDFREFAVFGINAINVADGAIVRWKASPRYRYREPLRIGTNASKASQVNVSGNSFLTDINMYVPGNASPSVLSDTCLTDTSIVRIDATQNQLFPVFHSPIPDLSSLVLAIALDANVSFGTWTLTSSKKYNSMRVTGTATLSPSAPGMTAQIVNDLILDGGGRLYIDHDLIIVVGRDLSITNGSAIEVVNGAHLQLFVGRDLLVDNSSAIGMTTDALDECNSAEDGLVDYADPSEVRIYTSTSTTNATWTVSNNSAVRGMLYAPNAFVVIDTGSFVAGSVFGSSVDIQSGSFVHYDHALDARAGYTNPRGLLFASPQVLDTRVHNFASTSGIGKGKYYVQVDGQALNISSAPFASPALTGADLSAPAPRNRQVHRRLKIKFDLFQNP